MTGSYHAQPKPSRPRKPKSIISANLRDVYAEVAVRAVELRGRWFTHLQVCGELNRLGFTTRTGKGWRHPQQIIKLIRSFGSTNPHSTDQR